MHLPIYWTDVKKNVPSKTYLMGMNWYNKANYHVSNKCKKHYHELVINLLKDYPNTYNQFKVEYTLYYKNPTSDGGNIIGVIEKFFLDGLIHAGIISNDNVKFHLGSSWTIGGQDRDNPRVEISIQEV